MKKLLCSAAKWAIAAGVWMMMTAIAAAQAQAPATATAPAVAPVAAPAAAPASEVKAQPPDMFTFGGDIRIREEYREDITPTVPSQYDYFRFRTRVWGQVEPDQNVSIRARLASELRDWEDPDMSAMPDAKTYVWPDELVIDNLYVDFHDLMAKNLDIRVGRQDLFYGTGKLFADGTPGDGSRTYYFNAVKATWKGVPETTIDVLGIYDPARNPMAINRVADRDLNGYIKGLGKVDETAAGIYLVNKSFKNMPIELYDIFKTEGDYNQTAKTNSAGLYTGNKAWQTLDTANKVWHNPDYNLDTAGFRLVPTFDKTFDGSLEAAYQFGQRGNVDTSGYMVDALANCHLPVMQDTLMPTITAELYYLSGDDPKTSKDEGWGPLFSRCPQISELFGYGLSTGDQVDKWSNMMMPTLAISAKPVKAVKTTAAISYVTAPEKDGTGPGDVRGTLYVAKAEFDLGKGYIRKGKTPDSLAAHLWIEALEPGNYYAKNDEMVFARWQIQYTF